jgi:hypothetical protein
MPAKLIGIDDIEPIDDIPAIEYCMLGIDCSDELLPAGIAPMECWCPAASWATVAGRRERAKLAAVPMAK